MLFNPQLGYKKRTIDGRPFWENNYLQAETASQLATHGFIQFSPTLKHGRAVFNEAFWLRPHEALSDVQAPTLIVHGTKDTLVSIESSRSAVNRFGGPCELVEIEGAQHGFAVHEDPQYLNPQSQEWQRFVIRTVAERLATPV